MTAAHDDRTNVLSIQVPSLGHKVFGGSLRRAYERSTAIEFRAFWTDDEREMHARVVNQGLRARVPSRWVSERNADLRRVRANLGYAYYGRRLVQRMQRRFPVDVLHFNTQTAALLSTDFMRRTPSVVTLDQTAAQDAVETRAGWQWTHEPSSWFERAVFTAAAAIVPFSQYAARSVLRQHDIGEDRIRVIPIGIDLSAFAGIDREERFAVHDRPLRILFVGGDFVRKGGPLLVDCFLDHFAAQGFELHLVTSARDIVAHPQIFVHRDVAPHSPQWMRLYALADIFVLPTRHEAFGIAFIEAMAAGIPVVGTAISAIPEIVLDTQTGFLVARDDRRQLVGRIAELATNPLLRREFGERGVRRAAAKFDVDKTTAQFCELLVSLDPRSSKRAHTPAMPAS